MGERGGGVGFFQARYREHGTRITVSSDFAMYSNAMGRGGGYVSIRLIAEIKDHCF